MRSIDETEWDRTLEAVDSRGYACLPGVLSESDCRQLITGYSNDDLYRSTIDMKRYRFGEGQYRYFQYPLPDLVQHIRHTFYQPLAKLANRWNNVLNIDLQYPARHDDFIAICRQEKQLRPTPLILRYGAGGFNTLHQDLYGDVYFPFQVVFMLTEQNVDYEGGYFLLTEQVPRAQSIGRVVSASKGDAVIFTTNYRPVKGNRGYYRAKLKHGVSEVVKGQRYAMGVIFHDGK